ncbi:MAG: hypothetical protein ACD_2C00190G0004 [uncultured bacterium (gcode 4)]|uniref:Uncharacterized protein n=1 Tax=uncultured bacterium (gcode 4) TaxID=1234023 RepID=K2FDV7_9BACT|nr:MAG: hypothetical protein ACD_2C00190G0004 [uncultured bacterium (gcode 4)]
MKKILLSILTCLLLFPTVFSLAYADTTDLKWDAKSGQAKATYADDAKFWFGSSFFNWAETWEKWAKWFLFRLAKDLKDVFIALAIIYMIILVLRLFFWQWTDDDFKKWRIWILWTTIWIVLMQMSYVAVTTIFNKDVWTATAVDVTNNLIMPIIRLLEIVTSFIFIAMAIMAFFRIVWGWWNEEGYKKGINSIINAIIWFILVKVSAKLVYSIYWNVECTETILGTQQCKDTALGNPNLPETTKIIATIIQYAAWFIWVITIVLIVYAWFLIITSNWNEDKVKKWKATIKYIIFWMVLIAASVILFNFMLWKDLTWIVGSFK